jgi:hypothetical protein
MSDESHPCGWVAAGCDSPKKLKPGDAYRAATATPFAALAISSATTFGCDT